MLVYQNYTMLNGKTMQDFTKIYEISIIELNKLIKSTKTRPSEKAWNKYAVENGFLLSGTIKYISGKSFNILCREIIKQQK